jgi:hypothetical protein
MERYVIFSIDSGQLLHKKQFVGTKDCIGLAMQLSALMHVAEYQIKVLHGEVTTCFAKDPASPLAIAAEFTPTLVTTEQGQQITGDILDAFIEKVGVSVRGRNRQASFKEFEQSLVQVIRTTVQTSLRQLCVGLEVAKLQLLIKKPLRRSAMSAVHERRSEFFSGITSAFSSISAESSFVESRSLRSFSPSPSVKYALRPEVIVSSSPEEKKIMSVVLDEFQEFDSSQTKALLDLCTAAEQSLDREIPDQIDLHLPCGDIKVLNYIEVQVLMLCTGGDLRADWGLQLERLQRWANLLYTVAK